MSFKTSFLAPRNRTVHAFGSLHSSMNVKDKSPIFLTTKTPAPVPIQETFISSALFTMTAPHALAILFASVFLNLLRTLTPALMTNCLLSDDQIRFQI